MNVRTTILGVPFDRVSLAAALERAEQSVRHRQFIHVATPGPEFVMTAVHHLRFRRILQRVDVSLADGFGITLAAKVLHQPPVTRISGMDFLTALIERATEKGWKIFLYGGRPGIVEQAARRLWRSYPQLKIVGIESGRRAWYRLSDRTILKRIRQSQADVLLVALGAPHQELWIDRHRTELGPVCVAVGVGGAFDFWSGAIRRAPVPWQRMGMEWAWRLLQQPRHRWRRIRTATVGFSVAIFHQWWREHV